MIIAPIQRVLYLHTQCLTLQLLLRLRIFVNMTYQLRDLMGMKNTSTTLQCKCTIKSQFMTVLFIQLMIWNLL